MPSSPPTPLILSGWVYTSDIEKNKRWEETIKWAANNGCAELLDGIPDDEYYAVDESRGHETGDR